MKECKQCGSRAINMHLHGRKEGEHPDLCDVCYWRFKMAQIKQELAKYIRSEGCSCCRDESPHKEAQDALGELLGFEPYDDNSGYNFYAPMDNCEHRWEAASFGDRLYCPKCHATTTNEFKLQGTVTGRLK